MAMIETREEFIRASIERIKELYPTTTDYFIQHFGLTQEQIDTMREFYLEEGMNK
jgi:protein-tyrosine phosphatase